MIFTSFFQTTILWSTSQWLLFCTIRSLEEITGTVLNYKHVFKSFLSLEWYTHFHFTIADNMKNAFGWFILQFKLETINYCLFRQTQKHLKIKLFVPLVKSFQSLTNVTKNSILDVTGVLSRPLWKKKIDYFILKAVFISFEVIKYLYTPRKVLPFRPQY